MSTIYGVTDERIDWVKSIDRERVCDEFVKIYCIDLGFGLRKSDWLLDEGLSFEAVSGYEDIDFGNRAVGPFAAVRRVVAENYGLGLAYTTLSNGVHVLGVETEVDVGCDEEAWRGDPTLPYWIGEQAERLVNSGVADDFDVACDIAVGRAVDDMQRILSRLFGVGELEYGFYTVG